MADCAQCGAELVEDEAYCRSCGAPVGVGDAESSGAGNGESSSPNRAVLVAAVIVVGLLLAGGVVYAIAQLPIFSAESAKAPSVSSGSSSGASQTATPAPSVGTAPTSSQATTASASAAGAKPAETADDGKQFGAITKVAKIGGVVKVTMDYKVLYTGAEAEKVAKQQGGEVNNDYYIVNDNKKLRTFPVTSGAKVVLHPGAGPQYSHEFTLSEFVTMFNDGSEKTAGGHAYTAKGWNWYVTIKNGRVIRIENFWTP